MSENAERLLMPRLRFPEFEAVIQARPLSNVAEIVTEKVRVDDLRSEQYVSTENLLADFGGMTATGNLPSVSSVTCFRPKDILVSNIRPYLKKVWQSDRNGGASNDVLVIRAKAHVNAEYLAAILRSDIFIDYIMRGAKGVKMPRGEISMIREFPIPCPFYVEQQKIADCLSSLDELITLESQKLNALKTHKKGMIQQLFPAGGETVPRLRFPEFWEAGEWTKTKICDAVIYESSTLSQSKLKTTSGGYPVFGADGIVGYIDCFDQKEDYIAIVKDGSGSGRLTFIKGESSILSTLGNL